MVILFNILCVSTLRKAKVKVVGALQVQFTYRAAAPCATIKAMAILDRNLARGSYLLLPGGGWYLGHELGTGVPLALLIPTL